MTTKPLHLDMHEAVESAFTLASRFYTDPHILDIEREKIFRRTWQLVGTLDQVCGEEEDCHRVTETQSEAAEGIQRQPAHALFSDGQLKTENARLSSGTHGERQTVNGERRDTEHGTRSKSRKTISDPETYFTTDVAGEPVIVVRDKQGTLRAFSNVCRHRAGPIALGSGCKNVLRCQYHGWTYTLDGRLIGTPDVEGVEFFDRSTMGMVPLRCEVWEDFIFVNFDREEGIATESQRTEKGLEKESAETRRGKP